MGTLREEIMTCAEGPVRPLEAEGPRERRSPEGRPIGRLAVPGAASPDQGWELTFRLGTDFTGFRGHFPGHPVLPAFVQLMMAECAVRMHSTRSWTLRRVERGKFLKPIGPNEPVTVCWQEQPQEDGLRCNFTLRVGAEKAAVFALEFSAEEEPHA
jgi:3-hydroxyacyl-[acyl-carrier-protein] dehydratase